MRRYNVLQALYLSFYSKPLYRDVNKNWGGYTFLYLLFLLALAWIPFTHSVQYDITRAYERFSDWAIEQTPVMVITNGKVSTPENRPYFITDPKTHENVAVIDTSGKFLTLEDAKTTILITETEVITGPKPHEIRTNRFPDNLNMTIDPKTVNFYVKDFVGYAWLFIFPFMVLMSFILRLTQAIIFGILGKLFSVLCGVKLTYIQNLLLVMVAMTPSIIISTILEMVGVHAEHQVSYLTFLTLIYMCFAVLSNKQSK